MTVQGFAIDVQGLCKSFSGKKVVDNVAIQVPSGKVYGFLGPNGSGKTTTLRLICGLLTPDAGQGHCLGFDIAKQSLEIKKRVGYMTQKFSYWTDLTIRENLEFVAQLYGLSDIKSRVDKTLDSLNLKTRQRQLAECLSGGWKQRLALAASILHEPQLLLLDEPTAGVDPKARREFWDEIHRLAEQGLTVLVSTHYMDEAERCHAIVYMSYGKIMTKGTVQEVVKGANLTTWMVKGQRLMDLASTIQSLPGVIATAPFGESLHVSGVDRMLLINSLQPFFNDKHYQWAEIEPCFEDVFIRYMNASCDNITG
jgi:ABC-2 type transport system ATP-binding protein